MESKSISALGGADTAPQKVKGNSAYSSRHTVDNIRAAGCFS